MAYISDYSDDESDYEINTIETKFEPKIIKYDYALMRSTRIVLHGDLIAWYWSPRRVAAFLNAGGDIDDLDDKF